MGQIQMITRMMFKYGDFFKMPKNYYKNLVSVTRKLLNHKHIVKH